MISLLKTQPVKAKVYQLTMGKAVKKRKQTPLPDLGFTSAFTSHCTKEPLLLSSRVTYSSCSFPSGTVLLNRLLVTCLIWLVNIYHPSVQSLCTSSGSSSWISIMTSLFQSTTAVPRATVYLKKTDLPLAQIVAMDQRWSSSLCL